MARFNLQDFDLLDYEIRDIRREVAQRMEAFGVPVAPFSLATVKLKRVIANMEAHKKAIGNEVRILKREYDRAPKPDRYDLGEDVSIRYYLKRRFLSVAELHAQLWTTVYNLRRRLEQLEAAGATQFSEDKNGNAG
jgi:hypothetical protein